MPRMALTSKPGGKVDTLSMIIKRPPAKKKTFASSIGDARELQLAKIGRASQK